MVETVRTRPSYSLKLPIYIPRILHSRNATARSSSDYQLHRVYSLSCRCTSRPMNLMPGPLGPFLPCTHSKSAILLYPVDCQEFRWFSLLLNTTAKCFTVGHICTSLCARLSVVVVVNCYVYLIPDRSELNRLSDHMVSWLIPRALPAWVITARSYYHHQAFRNRRVLRIYHCASRRCLGTSLLLDWGLVACSRLLIMSVPHLIPSTFVLCLPYRFIASSSLGNSAHPRLVNSQSSYTGFSPATDSNSVPRCYATQLFIGSPPQLGPLFRQPILPSLRVRPRVYSANIDSHQPAARYFRSGYTSVSLWIKSRDSSIIEAIFYHGDIPYLLQVKVAHWFIAHFFRCLFNRKYTHLHLFLTYKRPRWQNHKSTQN